MKSGIQQVIEHLEQAVGLTDGQLLDRFASSRDEASFAALVRRHGPMVLGVCRRVLHNHHDAEDAFQATFLVLAHKATSVLKRESVGCWLHGVAYHTAVRACAAIARRAKREKQVDEMPHPEVAPEEVQDWLPVLDRELNRLPEKYRAALVACDLEGKSRKDAAGLLGVAEGTLSSRLVAGRRMLAKRLARSGLALAGAVTITQVPSALANSTVQAACGQLTASTTAVLLMNEVVKTMLVKKLRLVAGAVLVLTALGVVGLGHQIGNTPMAQAAPPSELEALRKENELLKLNLLVVLEKVRSQDAELQALREPSRSKGVSGFPGAGGFPPGAASGMRSSPGGSGQGVVPPGGAIGPMGGGVGGGDSGAGLPGGSGTGSGFSPPSGGTFRRGQGPAVGMPPSRNNPLGRTGGAPIPQEGSSSASAPGGTETTTSVTDPVQEAETAVKALRAAKDKDSKRKATEALDKAMKKLKETIK